jgi:hypothetical protein
VENPAPRPQPLVAAGIWSGTVEVNTSPGHAASSMPYPTKPPCNGSCPDPAGDQAHLAWCRSAGARDVPVGHIHRKRRMRGSDTGHGVDEHTFRVH